MRTPGMRALRPCGQRMAAVRGHLAFVEVLRVFFRLRLVPFRFPCDVVSWSAQAGVAGLGGGVGGGAGEGLAVAGQQQGGVDGAECRQGGEGGAAVVGEGA
jgi:hypothetical protein